MKFVDFIKSGYRTNGGRQFNETTPDGNLKIRIKKQNNAYYVYLVYFEGVGYSYYDDCETHEYIYFIKNNGVYLLDDGEKRRLDNNHIICFNQDVNSLFDGLY